jgi:hypothetical protein
MNLPEVNLPDNDPEKNTVIALLHVPFSHLSGAGSLHREMKDMNNRALVWLR